MILADATWIHCPTCHSGYRWQPDRAGRKLCCATCADVFRMPVVASRQPTLVRRADGQLAISGLGPNSARLALAATVMPAPPHPRHASRARLAPPTLPTPPARWQPQPIKTHKTRAIIPAFAPPPARAPATIPPPDTGGLELTGHVVCPSCRRWLEPGSVMCAPCGIQLPSGKPLITDEPADEAEVYKSATAIIRVASFVAWLGAFPIHSEARGGPLFRGRGQGQRRGRPWATWVIVAATVLASLSFLWFDTFHSPRVRDFKNLLLWSGHGEPDAPRLLWLYEIERFGDRDAFEAHIYAQIKQDDRLVRALPDAPLQAGARTPQPAAPPPAPPPALTARETAQLRFMTLTAPSQAIINAHQALTPQQSCLGQFRWWQLFTHALLHGGLFHLAANMLFLLILGRRVNALIGNAATLVLYPLLGVTAALTHLWAARLSPSTPLLGASGAVMGLGGMYLIFFPLQRIHIALWIRPWLAFFPVGVLLFRFRLFLKFVACRGFWVPLFYITCDVIDVLFRQQDGVAHWAHVGGFATGMLLATLLLATRAVNAGGTDLISVTLGRRAWKIVGKPSRWADRRTDAGWLQRIPFFDRPRRPQAQPTGV